MAGGGGRAVHTLSTLSPRAQFLFFSSHHLGPAAAGHGHGHRHAPGYDPVTGLTSPQVEWAPPPPVAFVRGRIVNAETGAGVRMQVRENWWRGREWQWGAGAWRHRQAFAGHATGLAGCAH